MKGKKAIFVVALAILLGFFFVSPRWLGRSRNRSSCGSASQAGLGAADFITCR